MLNTQHCLLDYHTHRAWSGTIWARVLPRSHKRRSTTVQPYRSVFPGCQSFQMEQSCWKAMPQLQWPCKSKFQKVNPGLPDAVTRFSKADDQLIRWPCIAKKPAFMLIHEFMHVRHSYSATLTTAASIRQWNCQQCRRRANRSSLQYLTRISTRSETNMTVCHLHCAKSEEDNHTQK